MEMNTQRMDAFMKDVTDCRKAIDLCQNGVQGLEGMHILITDCIGDYSLTLDSNDLGLSKESQIVINATIKSMLEAREQELLRQMDELMGNYGCTIDFEAVSPALTPRRKRRQSSGPINPDDVEW